MATGLLQSGIEYIIKDSTARGTAGVLGSLKTIEKEVKGVQSLLKTGLTIGLGVLGVRSIVGEIREVADEIDRTAKASDRLGVATESYTSLKYAASQAGVGVERFATSVEQMVRNVSEAAQGSGRAKDAIADLGLSAGDLARQDPQQMLYEFADALDQVPNRADRVRIAMKLFGAEGAEMVNFLQEGSDAIRAMQAEGVRAGVTYTREQAAMVEEAKDAWARMKETIIKGPLTQAVIELAPYIEGITKALTEATTAGGGFGEVMVATFEAVGDAVSRTLEEIEKIANPQRSIGNWAYNQGIATQIESETRRRYEAALAKQQYRQSPYEDQILGAFGTVVAHQQGAPRYQDMYDAIQKQVTADFVQYTDNPYAGPDYAGRFQGIVADARKKITEAQARSAKASTFDYGGAQLDAILGDLTIPQSTAAGMGPEWNQEASRTEEAIAKIQRQAEALRQTLAGVSHAEERLAFADQAAGAFGEGTSAYTDAVTRYGEALDSLQFQEMAQEAAGARDRAGELTAALDGELAIIGRLGDSHDRAAKQVEYERLVRQGYAGDLERQTQLIDRYREGLEKLRNAQFINTQMQSLADTLADIAIDFENAADAAESFFRSLARQAISQYATQPLVTGIGDLFKSFWVPSAGTASGASDITSGSVGTAHAHAGGVLGVDRLPLRPMDLSLFAGAKRYHTGLMPGEVPAILKRDEGVFTPAQMAALGRGSSAAATGAGMPKSLKVQITNPSGQPMEAESAGMDFDLEEAVVSIVLRSQETGGRLRRGMRG